MRKKILKVGKTSFGITLSPTFLELLGKKKKKKASNYTLDISFKDNSLIISNPQKIQNKEDGKTP